MVPKVRRAASTPASRGSEQGGGGLEEAGSRHSMLSSMSFSDKESKKSIGTEARANAGNFPLSPSIDVWAVGVLTYVLLVGRHPFKRGSMQGVSSLSKLERINAEQEIEGWCITKSWPSPVKCV